MKKKLEEMSVSELEAEAFRLTERRLKARKDALKVQAMLGRRNDEARVAAMLGRPVQLIEAVGIESSEEVGSEA